MVRIHKVSYRFFDSHMLHFSCGQINHFIWGICGLWAGGWVFVQTVCTSWRVKEHGQRPIQIRISRSLINLQIVLIFFVLYHLIFHRRFQMKWDCSHQNLGLLLGLPCLGAVICIRNCGKIRLQPLFFQHGDSPANRLVFIHTCFVGHVIFLVCVIYFHFEFKHVTQISSLLVTITIFLKRFVWMCP